MSRNEDDLPKQAWMAVLTRSSACSYASRLSSRSALYTGLRLLLEGQNDALPSSAYRSLVINDNRLTLASTAARQKMWKELRPRYLLDRHDVVFAAFFAEWQACRSEQERGLLAYLLFALNDCLVADLGIEWLFSYLVRAPTPIRVEEVRTFIDGTAIGHPEVTAWSEDTRASVARHYMASIRDFGLAQGIVKKSTVRPALYGAPVRFLIRALRLSRVKPLDIVQSRVFRLLAIDTTEVISVLGELNRMGELRFRMQADVIELDFPGAP